MGASESADFSGGKLACLTLGPMDLSGEEPVQNRLIQCWVLSASHPSSGLKEVSICQFVFFLCTFMYYQSESQRLFIPVVALRGREGPSARSASATAEIVVPSSLTTAV